MFPTMLRPGLRVYMRRRLGYATWHNMSLDPSQFRAALSQFASGVTVVTSGTQKDPVGITVSAFSSVSLDPPVVLVCINNKSRAQPRMVAAGHFAVNILHESQVELGARFAGMIRGLEDRFSGVNYTTTPTGSPVFPGVLAWLECRVSQTHAVGDHTVFYGEVLSAGQDAEPAPLLYYDRDWRGTRDLPGEHS